MKNTDEKIIHLLDKVLQITRYIQWQINKKTGISPLSAQIIEYLGNASRDLRTPAKIAEELGITRPTVTEALKSLIKKGYIKEKVSPKDKRFKILYLTEKGKKLLKNSNLNYKDILKKSIKNTDKAQKENLFYSLINFVADLNKRGILPIARICFNCKNFEKNKFEGSKKPHYCKLLKQRMGNFDLNVNCEENLKRRSLWVKK